MPEETDNRRLTLNEVANTPKRCPGVLRDVPRERRNARNGSSASGHTRNRGARPHQGRPGAFPARGAATGTVRESKLGEWAH